MANILDQISKSVKQSSKTSSQEAPVVPKEPTETQTKDEKCEESETSPSEAPPENEKCEESDEEITQIGCIWS